MSETKKPWVDGPFALISASKSGDSPEKPAEGARKCAAEMTVVHNLFLRGINAIYVQAVNVAERGTAKDKSDFANFAWSWSQEVLEHHDVEESRIFPEINELAGVPGLMDANIEEHHLFHTGLDKFREYVDKLRKEEEELDGEKLKGIIDSFMPVLRTHLENEIDTLVGLEKYADRCDWGAWFQKVAQDLGAQGMKSASHRNEILPLAMILHDKTFEGGIWGDFPPLPWLAMVAIRWLFVRTHQDWWRFAGCDSTSMPQELPFA
ncbi:uncharacterized protein B0J16DRAFT_330264 [Fusarium flagelliforme]|uniref:Hemerythrin-like domain-containing protein n=1 Tax=Fusarium flagelliforme TaxID=2675880 RepID=A0A395N657_9HYPO|nr:uncharacterized protein B0J16DRAFT_330264 [Fusarium flagelliforme]KAH7198336.1 hypothetical protein B0J16DRAFT_330264 [Fusarium flagelliforme]RFN55263.1 hypothetical protein FIE12Z_516 [Fusarium flagelliforme]